MDVHTTPCHFTPIQCSKATLYPVLTFTQGLHMRMSLEHVYMFFCNCCKHDDPLPSYPLPSIQSITHFLAMQFYISFMLRVPVLLSLLHFRKKKGWKLEIFSE